MNSMTDLVASFLDAGKQREKERRKKLKDQAAILAKMNAIYKSRREPDWAQIITEILDAGVESVGLAMALGKSKSWADNYVRSGTKKMDYKVGVALLAIHKEMVK